MIFISIHRKYNFNDGKFGCDLQTIDYEAFEGENRIERCWLRYQLRSYL